MKRVVARLVVVALWVASAPAAAGPEQVAEEVHRAGRYPDALDIAEPKASPRSFGGGDSSESGTDGADDQGKDQGGGADSESGTDGADGWGENEEGEGDSSTSGTDGADGSGEDDGEGWSHDGWGDDPRGRDPSGRGPDGSELGSHREPVVPGGGLLGAFGSFLSHLLLVVLLGVLIVFIGWLLSRFSLGRGRADAAPPEPAEGGGFPGDLAALAARDLSADPDQLARDGRFGEAIELLLLQSLQRSGWDPQRGESLTARDVVRSLADQDGRRGILGRIVDLAERVRFGGAQPTLDLYSRMKHEFAHLTGAEVA